MHRQHSSCSSITHGWPHGFPLPGGPRSVCSLLTPGLSRASSTGGGERECAYFGAKILTNTNIRTSKLSPESIFEREEGGGGDWHGKWLPCEEALACYM